MKKNKRSLPTHITDAKTIVQVKIRSKKITITKWTKEKIVVYSALAGGVLLLFSACGNTTLSIAKSEQTPSTILQHQKIGQEISLNNGVQITLKEIQSSVPINPMAQVQPNTKSFGFLVQICTPSTFNNSLETTKFDFSVSLNDANQGNVIGSEGQKEPQFINKTLLSQDCNSGWITADYPGTTSPKNIRYTLDKYIVEWSLS